MQCTVQLKTVYIKSSSSSFIPFRNFRSVSDQSSLNDCFTESRRKQAYRQYSQILLTMKVLLSSKQITIDSRLLTHLTTEEENQVRFCVAKKLNITFTLSLSPAALNVHFALNLSPAALKVHFSVTGSFANRLTTFSHRLT